MAVEFTGWNKLIALVDPERAKRRMRQQSRKRLQEIGKIAVGVVVRDIAAKKYAPNAASTIKRKGFNWPVVETGALMKAITSWTPTHKTCLVGVRVSHPRAKIAEWVHQGTNRAPARPFLVQALADPIITKLVEKKALAVLAKVIEP